MRLVYEILAEGTYPSSPAHGFRHLLIAPQCLYPKADCLELCAHLVELLDVAASANEVLGHDLARVLQTT